MKGFDKRKGMQGLGWPLPVLLLSFCVFLASSCALDMGMGEEKVDNARNSCSSDADCPAEGSVCDTDRNICVSMPAGPGEGNFLVEVIPLDSTGSSFMPSQYFIYNGVANRDEMDQPFVLADYIKLKGIVKWTDDDYMGLCSSDQENLDGFGNCIVNAKVELSPAGDFPDTLRPVATVTTGQDASFSFVTVPGVYTMRVIPQSPFDAYLPPMKVKDPVSGIARMDIAEAQNLDIRYESLPICGSSGIRLVDGSVLRSSSGGRLGTGVSVWAVDPYTGDRISSIARVDAQNIATPAGDDPANPGVINDEIFRLYLAPEDAGTGIGDSFYVAISSDEVVPQIPTIKLGPYKFSELDIWNALGGDGSRDNCANFDAEAVPETSQLNLPPIDPRIQYSATVEGVLDDESTEPIGGVKVRFYTDDIEGEGTVGGSYELFATTDIVGNIVDSNGNPSVYLVPGYYAVSFYPPLGSDYEASRVTSVLIEETPVQGRTFQLQRKKVLDGLILKLGTGEPLRDVTLEAYPLATGTTVITRYNSTWSDSTGLFSILLDAGSYNMVFMPSPGSNLPWIWFDGVSVLDIIQQYESAAEPWTISISDPVIFEGRVLDSAGAAVDGADVKVYQVVYSPMDEPPQTRQIAKTSTTTDGGFTALIAPTGGPWQ